MSEPNNRHFENEWEMAFDNTEIKPSDSVWKEIELNLAKSENNSNKKRILFFQLLAAASVSFAMVVGSIQLYNVYYNNDQTAQEIEAKRAEYESEQGKALIENHNNINDADSSNDIQKSSLSKISNESDAIAGKENLGGQISANDLQSKDGDVTKSFDQNETLAVAANVGVDENKNVSNTDLLVSEDFISTKSSDDTSNKSSKGITASGDNNSIASLNDDQLTLIKSDVNSKGENDYLKSLGYELDYTKPGQIEMHMVPWLVYADNQRKSNLIDKSTWTGISMAAGAFNPNSSNGSDLAMAMDRGLTVNEASGDGFSSSRPPAIGDEKVGNAYSVGLNLGTRLTEKLVVIGGVNYLQQTTTSSSNVVATGGNNTVVSSYNDLGKSSQFQTTDQYEIRSTYETISLPIQAGIYLIDRKLNVLVLGGVANDFFIRKNLADATGKSSGESKSFNDDGYSLYSIGGLIGTQVSYDIGEHYSIAIQPQIKQMLNSFTPDGNKPTTFEIGFRFNYILK